MSGRSVGRPVGWPRRCVMCVWLWWFRVDPISFILVRENALNASLHCETIHFSFIYFPHYIRTHTQCSQKIWTHINVLSFPKNPLLQIAIAIETLNIYFAIPFSFSLARFGCAFVCVCLHVCVCSIAISATNCCNWLESTLSHSNHHNEHIKFPLKLIYTLKSFIFMAGRILSSVLNIQPLKPRQPLELAD